VADAACYDLIVRRWIFNLAATTSLAFCLAIIALWLRSYWRADTVSLFPSPQRHWIVRSAAGRMHGQQWLATNSLWEGVPNNYSSGAVSSFGGYLPMAGQFAGFGYHHGTGPFPGTTIGGVDSVLIPHAFFAAIFALLPGLWLRSAMRRRAIAARVKAHLCLDCGYDLRASKDRCPECGTAIPPAAAA
jgi:hypothetical protein